MIQFTKISCILTHPRAKLAEQAERYDEMAEIMKELVQAKTSPLNTEESAVFAVAFMNVSGERRAAWRKLYAIERQEAQRSEQSVSDSPIIGSATAEQIESAHSLERRPNQQRNPMMAISSRKTNAEEDVLSQVLSLLNDHLIPLADPLLCIRLRSVLKEGVSLASHSPTSIEEAEKAIEAAVVEALEMPSNTTMPNSNKESLVFWFKMAGDYRRFLAEFLPDGSESRDKEMQKGLEAYVIASTIAKLHLPSIHPIRLGLALNFSAFFFEILQMRTLACRLAENSFNQAVADMDQFDDKDYQDSKLVMQLLKDNLRNWTADDQEEDEPEKDIEKKTSSK